MKKIKPVRSHVLQIRVTEWEKNRIEGLAKIYAGGNTSLWVAWAALNTDRQKITDQQRKGRARRVRK